MSCESSSNEVKLAREYRCLLSNIKPLIEELDKSKDAQLCLLWLSKLDQCHRSEGHERNEILSELSRQVKKKCLEPPFNTQPPSGSLKNITLRNSIRLRGSNDYSDDVSSELTSGTSVQSPCSSFSNQSCEDDHLQTPGTTLRSKLTHNTWNSLKSLRGARDKPGFLAPLHESHERVMDDQLLIERYEDIIKSLVNQKLKNIGSVQMKSLKSWYENKIRHLSSSLRLMEEENNNLKQKISADSVSCKQLLELELRNAQLREKIGQLEKANNTLELRCMNLEKEKDCSTLELTDKLSDSEKRLKEMDNHIKTMEKKYEENFRTCKAEHQVQINELEKRYTCELSKWEQILEDKQSEIGNLMEQFSAQCFHFEAEILRLKHDTLQNPELEKEKRKVKFLKSKLKNVEKLNESLAIAFQAQLEQLVAKKDLVISTLELKLKSQECDKVGNALQPGLDNLISEKICLLETQYRKLLEESENHAIQRRQIDLQKILTLEKQLVDHGVGIQDASQIPCPEHLLQRGQTETLNERPRESEKNAVLM